MPEGIGESPARKDVSYVLFMKLTVVTTIVLLTLFARGFRPGILIFMLIIPFWLLAEKVMSNTNSPSLWKSIEKRENFSRLPLAEDINKMKAARKGQEVKQAILEGRLKEQVYKTLKNEYNISNKEISNSEENLEEISKKINNEKLIEYLRNAKDLNDLKKPDSEEQNQLFSDVSNSESNSKKPEFEEKIESAINELERIHHIEEGRRTKRED